MRRLSLLAFGLALLAGSSALAGRPGAVEFKEPGFLDVTFAWEGNPGAGEGVREAWTRVSYSPPGERVFFKRLGDGTFRNPALPIEELKVYGKWWVIMGELVRNPGVYWRYKDVFWVEDSSGESFKIDRAAFAKYPDLPRRISAARIRFDRMEISVTALQKNGREIPLLFKLSAEDFLIASEGTIPYMAAPASPLKWSDSVEIARGTLGRRAADPGNKSWPRLWRELVAIKQASIRIYGLAIPKEELASIARTFQAREKARDEIEKTYAVLRDDRPVVKDIKPYAGTGDLARPYAEAPAEAAFDHEAKKYVIRSNSRTLAEFSATEVSNVEKLRGTRYFAVTSRSTNRKKIVNRHGKTQRLDREYFFDEIEVGDAQIVLKTKTGFEGSETEIACAPFIEKRWHTSYSEAREAIEEWKEAAERRDERDGEEGTVRLCALLAYRVVALKRLILDRDLNLLFSENGYETW